MTILNEWANVNLPHYGSTGMRNIANLRVPPSPTVIDLRTLFGASKNGSGLPYFLSVKADMAGGGSGGVKFYFALAANGIGTINPAALGSIPGVCYPLADGQEMRGRLLSHQESSPTGWSTMVCYTHIHFMAGGAWSGAAPSGYLRLYGSSSPEGSSRNNFPRP